MKSKSILLVVLLALSSCGIPPMVVYYRGTATGSDAAKSCYKILNNEGESRFNESLNLTLRGDSDAAAALWLGWEQTRAKGKKVCDALDGIAAEALAAAPVIEAAIDREKRIAEWVARLTKAAADAVAELKDLGIIKGGR
jgi:hypothetical protein